MLPLLCEPEAWEWLACEEGGNVQKGSHELLHGLIEDLKLVHDILVHFSLNPPFEEGTAKIEGLLQSMPMAMAITIDGHPLHPLGILVPVPNILSAQQIVRILRVRPA